MLENSEALATIQGVFETQPEEPLKQFADSIFDVDTLEQLGPYHRSSHFEAVTDETVAWVKQLKIVESTPESDAEIRAWASMNAYAHDGEPHKLCVSGKIYGVLFLMDDLLGNDAQINGLNQKEQQFLGQMLLSLKGTLKLVIQGQDPRGITFELPAASSAELTPFYRKAQVLFHEAWEVLQLVRTETDQQYTIEFSFLLASHLSEALKQQDEGILATIASAPLDQVIEQYLRLRRKVSGMQLGRKVTEYTAGSQLGVRALREKSAGNSNVQNFVQLLSNLEQCVDDFGGLGNDGLSARKEVLRDGTIFNYLPIVMLGLAQEQAPGTILFDQLYSAAILSLQKRLLQLTQNFSHMLTGDETQSSIFQLLDQLDETMLTPAGSELSAAEIKKQVRSYILGLQQYFLATYYWEIDAEGGKNRYQSTSDTSTAVIK